MSKIDVSPEIVNWIIQQIKDDHKYIKILEKVTQWKNGIKPTFKQLEEVSKKIKIPFGYFFLDEPPKEKLELLEFRTIDSINLLNPSRELIDTVRTMERIQDWMREYLIDNNYNPLEIVGSLRNNRNVQNIASKIRTDLGIKFDWFYMSKDSRDSFNKIRYSLENLGILVMSNSVVNQNNSRKLDVNEFRAFTLIDHYAPLIFINSNDSDNGKLFSILHESVHIWLGISNLFNDTIHDIKAEKQTEKICNSVTAEILIPTNYFIKDWQEINMLEENEKIDRLSKKYKCSTIVVARKALELKFINHIQYNQIVKTAIKYFKQKISRGKKSGPDYYTTLMSRFDSRFILALASSLSEGKTTYTEAYRLTNTNRKTFSRLVDRVKEKLI